MGYMNSEKPPSRWDAGWFKMFVERIRSTVNFLDNNNFVNKVILGSWLKDKTVALTALSNGMWEICALALAQGFTSTSTTAVAFGGFIHWEAGIFPSTARVYLEATIASTNNQATATLELYDASGTVLATVTSNAGTYEWKRSTSFAPPSLGQTLTLKCKTSNATYPVAITNVKLTIFL